MKTNISVEQFANIISDITADVVLISNLDNNDSFRLDNPDIRLENNYLKFSNNGGELRIKVDTITGINGAGDSIGFFTNDKMIMLMMDNVSEVMDKISQFE